MGADAADRRFARTLRSFDAMIAGPGGTGGRHPMMREADLLAMLLDVRDEETGAGLSDRELRDQVVTFPSPVMRRPPSD